MLWKKESSKPNALYVDIFGMCDKFIMDAVKQVDGSKLGFPYFDKAITVKNDAMSAAKRNQGNSLFAKNDWIQSMELYNESLCVAPERSKNIALAYANRSACFLKLKMYSQCLIDIELARKAGYPTEKMPKLNERQANCLKEMENSNQQPDQFVEQLNYEPNEKFPSMANVLDVVKDDGGKYSVIANQDIDVGQTVAVEKALFGCVFQHPGLKCNVCLKSNTNLIACKKCTMAMFCSAECQSSRLHEYECGIHPGTSIAGYRTMRDLRCLLTTINLFSTADELMDFIEQLNNSADQLPATMKDETSQYNAYFKLRHCDNDMGDELGVCIAPVYKLAMGIAQIKQMFGRAKKHERFLQHLIAHNLFITPESGRDTLNEYEQHSQVNVMMCYFNQSCAPNLISVPSNGHLTFITARPIKAGEELFDSTKSRQRDCCYVHNHGALCMCALCEGGAAAAAARQPLPQELHQQMFCNPNFKDIMAIGGPSKLEAYSDDKLQATMNKCVMFLKEFGHLEWCNEIAIMVKVYQEVSRMCYRKILR